MAKYGYAGEILKVDLSTHNTTKLATSDYADRFLGGKGIAAKLYWDMVPPRARAFDPENCLILANGPAAGFTRFTSSRWLACGKTATGDPEAFSYGNLGGSWGNRLKYAGYDALVVQGQADKPVYLFVHDGIVEIKDASHLWGKTAFEASDSLKEELGKAVSVLTIGQAAENRVVFATLLADQGASGSGGVGSIMGSKKLKAIAVAGDRRPVAADPERLSQLGNRVGELAKKTPSDFYWIIPGRTRTEACQGCGIGCTRQSYEEGGRRFKCFCQAIDGYRLPALKYYNGWNEVVLLSMRLCDQYGLDSSVMQAMIEWLIKCHEEGVLRDEDVGLPLSKIGGPEFIEALTRKIAMREGFGDMLARGTIKAAESIGGRAPALISQSVLNRSNEVRDYDPRLILHNALLIATEPRRALQQVHEASMPVLDWLYGLEKNDNTFFSPEDTRRIAEMYWGSAAAADYMTYEGKALAAKKIQDRTYAIESLILCNIRWPMIHKQTYRDAINLPSQIFSAITGWELDEAELDRIGERIFNLQRAILLRQGWGGRSGDRLLDFHHEEPLQYLNFDPECKVPGRNGEAVSRKGAVVDRKEFEKMKSEYYGLRGWDVESGLQSRARLKELQLEDVADDMDKRGLLK